MSIANLLEENKYNIYANSIKFTDTAPSEPLNVYYEETIANPILGYDTPANLTCTWIRVGRIVTMHIFELNGIITPGGVLTVAAGGIPLPFRRTIDISYPMPVSNAGVSQIGTVTLRADGSMQFGTSSGVVAGQPVPFSNVNFAASAVATSGPKEYCVTYVL